ncbi:S8 family serine peptidase [Saccharopolyspora sp. NFXS83]|uniref:S8 family serine peptidase n=1 Tax=Saccharopolyspora sp. NFXS83 TaxID=2993560 RepID=UPI00224AA765|nr:S8 family serine peptidase [Saccharopolyspora sp. NFXS83]MCX2729196.1 S8 family serine peptidase [Saccharopolyspora sp. NFXS83]
MCELSDIPGLAELREQTTGDERIRVAVLDGPVDLDHPVLDGAELRQDEALWPEVGAETADASHGTAVASVLFGGRDSAVPGVAPGCSGIIIPVFSAPKTSQLELARAIELATESGAHLINISGGQLTESAAEDVLARAVRRCQDRGALVLAAAGNDGCFCTHVPAALPSVIAVGAMDDAGRPMSTSNWGPDYQRHGLLAPGENVRCAVPGGGTTRRSGTSLATPIVAGVAALLLSRRLRSGRDPDPAEVRTALLDAADRCELDDPVACLRFLTGKLNVRRAVSAMTTNEPALSADTTGEIEIEPTESAPQPCGCGGDDGDCACGSAPADAPQPSEVAVPLPPAAAALPPRPEPVPEVVMSAEESYASLVYAIGALGFDFGTEARRDSFKQQMTPQWVPGSRRFDVSDSTIEEATISKVEIRTSGERRTLVGGHVEHAYLVDEDLEWKGISGGDIERGEYHSGEIAPDDKNPGYQMLRNARIDQTDISGTADSVEIAANPYDPVQMLEHLVKRADEAKALIWTLNLELTPIYSFEPSGPYAASVYDEFIFLLAGQLAADGYPRVGEILNAEPRFARKLAREPGSQGRVPRIERVGLAGRLAGRTVKLFSGQAVPVVDAEQPRGVFGWNVNKLIKEATVAAFRANPALGKEETQQQTGDPEASLEQQVEEMLRDFLNRIYYDLRNLGTISQDRALNAAATNAFNNITPLSRAAKDKMFLDSVEVEKSPYGRVDSDSWDVKLRFFDPENSKRARRVWRYTIDVSDLVPVAVGEPRTWQES